MDAFANFVDLGAKMRRTFLPGAEGVWIDELLSDASNYLRAVIGQDVYPTTQSTYVAYPVEGRVDIPQHPVVSVDAVERDGSAVTFTYRPGFLLVGSDDPVSVTFTWGYATVPAELARLACVLVSQALIPLESELGLTAGGLSSVQIDDFKLAWADAGSASGMTLTPHAEAAVRSRFGATPSTTVDVHA